jgi:hypothetical protein
MEYSKYNIFSKIRDSGNYFIVNLLSGNADILSPQEAEIVEEIRNGNPADSSFLKEMAGKGRT